jgi:TonB family protein
VLFLSTERAGIERHEMLERNSTAECGGLEAGLATAQLHRLQIALVLLLVALAVVLVKDREFWFGGDDAIESGAAVTENVPNLNSAAVPAKTSPTTAARAANAKNHPAPATSAEAAVPKAAHTSSGGSDSPLVATTRTVLPPMDVEVVAGDTHSIVHPGSSVAKVEIPGAGKSVVAVTTLAADLPTSAADRENLLNPSVAELHPTVDANYPLLGQHTKVQGSVVLQAVIGADGTIEDLRVLSGPAILSTAAQQAVRQWRFKPYFENGQPVETKARITVNFSIRISDNPAIS